MTKGAPEVVELLLAQVPDDYRATYRRLTLAGMRVLALAHRSLPAGTSMATVGKWRRSEVESGLTFAGFLVKRC